MRKPYEINKKKYYLTYSSMGDFDEILDKKPFFEHHTNGKTIEIESQFSLGWTFSNLLDVKKSQNKFISFTIVNTKPIVHTTVNTYCFLMILPLIMLYLRIVPFSVHFTI